MKYPARLSGHFLTDTALPIQNRAFADGVGMRIDSSHLAQTPDTG
jgi:hypothetical protein